MTRTHLGTTTSRVLLALVSLTLLGLSTGSAAQARAPRAKVASATSIDARSAAATAAATRARNRAEALISSRRRALAKCVRRHPSRCDSIREAIDRASSRVAAANSRLNEIKVAPTVTVSGETLTWNAIEGVESYVVVRTVAGRANSRWIVAGTSITPHALPGRTATFTVRTLTRHSEPSQPVSISYLAVTPPSEGSTPPAAPEGGTKTDPKTEEKAGSGTEGKTEEPKKPEEESAKPGTSFETGVVPTTLAGSEPSTVRQLGARSVRMEFAIGEPASALASAVEAYARVGVRVMPLAGFYGRLPSPAEARNLASWAATYGPGGSFWAGKSFPSSVAVTDIEFGNETSYSYQYSDNSASGVATRAQTYALRFKEAEIAVKEVNPSVGLLAQADDGGSGSPAWVNNMFAAVPDLAQRVAGWTVHPYGTTWQAKMDDLVNTTAAHGAAANIPIYVTELGISVDNGKCVSNNYGWNPCMTNSEAASTLANLVSGMRNRYGKRLRALYLYQAQDERAEGASNDRESYFGCLQSNGASKGAYTTEVESVLASGSSTTAVTARAQVASLHTSAHRQHAAAASSRSHRRRHHHHVAS
jgi:hypothetical protein